jgi:hypothetical protein
MLLHTAELRRCPYCTFFLWSATFRQTSIQTSFTELILVGIYQWISKCTFWGLFLLTQNLSMKTHSSITYLVPTVINSDIRTKIDLRKQYFHTLLHPSYYICRHWRGGGDIVPCSPLKSNWCSKGTSSGMQKWIPEDGTLHNHCCEILKSYKHWDVTQWQKT